MRGLSFFLQISKKNILCLPLCLSVAAVLLGCQPRSNKWSPGSSFRTQIIVSKSSGETQFQEVELQGLHDKSNLAGDVVDFYYSPSDENGELVGNKPRARFIEDDGVYIPANQITLQMVTLYYHLQQLKKLEIEVTGSSKSLLKWPRKVALAVNVINAPDLRFDNAFYNPNVDALFFVPYTEEEFPIPLNAGIIAHEHFHSYFAAQVMNPLGKQNNEISEEDYYRFYIFKIINEGLADVWGWIYSQDPDFVVVSLPKVGSDRNLEKSSLFSTRFSTEQELKHEIMGLMSDTKSCAGKDVLRCMTGKAYGHGTLLARGLKSFAKVRMETTGDSDVATRKIMAGKILSVISEMQKSLLADETLSLDKVFILWEKQFDKISKSECQVLQATVSAPGDLRCASSALSSTR